MIWTQAPTMSCVQKIHFKAAPASSGPPMTEVRLDCQRDAYSHPTTASHLPRQLNLQQMIYNKDICQYRSPRWISVFARTEQGKLLRIPDHRVWKTRFVVRKLLMCSQDFETYNQRSATTPRVTEPPAVERPPRSRQTTNVA